MITIYVANQKFKKFPLRFDTYILLAEVNSNIAILFCYLFNFICCLFAFNALQVLSFYLQETNEYVNGTSKIIEVQLGQKKDSPPKFGIFYNGEP